MFGIGLAVTKLASEELAIGNKEGIIKITNHSILVSFFCGIIVSIIFILFSHQITKYCLHEKLNSNITYIMSLSFPFISMSSAISGYFVAVRRVYKSTIAQFFEQFIKFFISLFFLKLLLKKDLEYACFALILGDFVSEFFSFFINYFIYISDSKIYKTSYSTFFSKNYYTKKVFRIAVPVATASFLRSGLSTLKQIIIPLSFEKGLIECEKSLSIYGEINGMAMPIVFFPNVIFSSVCSLILPEFSAYHVQKRTSKINQLTKLSIFITSIISILISIFLFLFAEQLSNIIYKTSSISNYIKIFSPMTIFIMLDCITDNILKGLDAQNTVVIINIIDTLIDVIVIYLFVPKFGITGYIFSLYLSESVNLILSLWKLYKIT